jgi:glycosyltransferase involved in cell wall biosynthesis
MKVCMLAYAFYEGDSRIMRYAEALAKRGHQVDAVTLASEGRPAYEDMNGVHVYRIQKRVIDEEKPSSYATKLLKFLFRSAWFLAKRSMKVPYDLVHVHNMPDFLVFAALVPKLRGAKVILDIHDLTPELYANKFESQNHVWRIRLLKRIEKMSMAFADFVIVANDIWLERLRERSVQADKIMTILNYPDPEIFRKRPPKSSNGKFIAVYPGTIEKHQGLDIAVKAFALLQDRIPQVEFHIYGDGHDKPKIVRLVEELGLQDQVQLKGVLTLREIYDVLSQADIGVVPKRKDAFGNEAFSTKILEFMAVGLPVVASDTRIDRLYFSDDVLCFFTSGAPQSLADSIVKVQANAAYRQKLVKNAFAYIAKNNWGVKQHEYLQLVQRLTGKNAFTEEESRLPEGESRFFMNLDGRGL